MVEPTDFIPTKASLLRKQSNCDYQEVTFVSHKSTKKSKKDLTKEIVQIKNNKIEEKGFNVKQAKNEIIKFGISGFDKPKQEEAKIQLAIKLGAKPPKNKYRNYKELLKEKKIEKEQQETQDKLLQLGKNSVGKSTAKGKSFDKKRKLKDGILEVYGKVVKSTMVNNSKKKFKK